MKSPMRQRQKIWFASITEKQDGMDTVNEYSKPVMKLLAVSATSGTPDEIAAGLVQTYDRYITSYYKDFRPQEGDVLWVDTVPEIDDAGNLRLKSDGYTPVTPPDYVLKKVIATQRGLVNRYGISKIGGSH